MHVCVCSPCRLAQPGAAGAQWELALLGPQTAPSQQRDDWFPALPSPSFLRLSRCCLQSSGLHPQVFSFSRLQELDPSSNQLAAVPTVPTSLQNLHLKAGGGNIVVIALLAVLQPKQLQY